MYQREVFKTFFPNMRIVDHSDDWMARYENFDESFARFF